MRRSARVSLRTDSATGGYRRLTHLRLVAAHAHDVLLVPLWLTVRVCSCRVEHAAAAYGLRLYSVLLFMTFQPTKKVVS